MNKCFEGSGSSEPVSVKPVPSTGCPSRRNLLGVQTLFLAAGH